MTTQDKLTELRATYALYSVGDANALRGPDGIIVALVDCAKSLDHATRELTLIYSMVELLAAKVPDAQADCAKAAALHADNMAVYTKRLAKLAMALEVQP